MCKINGLMMKNYLLIVILLILICGCKKDWGIQTSEKYQSIEGPEQYWKINQEIYLASSKESLNLNDECNIEAVVKQIKVKENGDTVSITTLQPSIFLFKWEVLNFESVYYYLVNQLRNGFKINNHTKLEAIGVNKIILSAVDYEKMKSCFLPSSSRISFDNVLKSIKKIYIRCTVKDVNGQNNGCSQIIGINF